MDVLHCLNCQLDCIFNLHMFLTRIPFEKLINKLVLQATKFVIQFPPHFHHTQQTHAFLTKLINLTFSKPHLQHLLLVF